MNFKIYEIWRKHQFKRALENERFYEDVFEAFAGALYLDQGFEITTNILAKIFLPPIKGFRFERTTNYKNELQEAIQAENARPFTMF